MTPRLLKNNDSHLNYNIILAIGIFFIHTEAQQIPLVRLPSNTLLKYTAYKDVSILHFRIPSDTRTAYFSFKAYEEKKSAFQRECTPKNVSLHLKAGSYPVISPENITFPKHFLNAAQRFDIQSLQFLSDGTTKRLSIDGPHPGNWFAVAFLSWTDPNNDRIEQQGLAASCETLLLSEMAVTRTMPIMLNEGTLYNNTLVSNVSEPINYKFFVPRSVDYITLRIVVQSICMDCTEISVYIQANGLPNIDNYMQRAIVHANQTNELSMDFYPQQNSWHYIDVNFMYDDDHLKNVTADNETVHAVDFGLMITHEMDEDNMVIPVTKIPVRRNFEYYELLRQTYREFFMFDYDLLPDVNGTVPAFLNLTGGTPAAFQFVVGDVYDIGGTLSFAVAMKDTIKESIFEKPITSGAIAEKLVDSSSIDSKQQLVRSNQTIIICMRLEEPGIPTWPDKCTYGRTELPAASIVNNTNEDTSTGLIHVPFPESGKWFVTMGLFCHGAETATKSTIIDSVKEFILKHVKLLDTLKAPCACRNQSEFYKFCINDKDCLAGMNETETLKVKECFMDSKCTKNYEDIAKQFDLHHKLATEQTVASDSSCNASVVFTISSSPCVAGRCGRYGRCYHYMSGGFVFSTCLCIKGYRGWDCTEDSQVPSSFSILIALLLLTLSNLLFIPSIYFGIRRKYYTESVIYFFAMFFSIFYHACDSGEDEYGFCLVKIGVLQFCDFYCGLLAIWVTLIAMAHIRQTFVSLLHIGGAILLAFGTELNKQSLWVFLAPALTGLCIISVSWGWKCRRTGKWFPARKYLAIFLPIGMVLVMVGLVCYAFLQTRQNYHIVHSIWHMVMAMSILCLLPSNKSFLPKC
ncbi:uncharacterized protein LOC119070122 [Bradysia coprophila]|uniref:uncharacterized protein LOC119070122 n=1 Tax=Bradysia coprophila TaxID=38358 RepID=UPI00187D9DDF|nr:uncharacterized protein LOC119070122 [Bradysia coprophila]XP_037030332.1 uncharacterized protein LOC119070122 [Bradysia coprophila]XP_037030334.1 uncharacterized protein LOC119070122 [Bradysia coprophila]XP_037030335.1 uncharacterized protein LOC119070122 [Bradysia coprophila]XP_037030336.1 uncharacterized protein LOC119070122 [Bradysia coprophila]